VLPQRDAAHPCERKQAAQHVLAKGVHRDPQQRRGDCVKNKQNRNPKKLALRFQKQKKKKAKKKKQKNKTKKTAVTARMTPRIP
jgi:hypothetical protein